MKKYLAVFKLSWQNVLEYRVNFVMGRLRDLLFLLTVYFLWTAVFKDKGVLFGFESQQITTYVLGASLISAFVFDYAMDRIAEDISRGDLSVFLTKPINFVIYHQVRRLASTAVSIILVSGGLLLFWILIRPPLFLQKNPAVIIFCLLSLSLAFMIFVAVDSIVGVTSFWTVYAYGPRFFLKLLIDFTSGRLFPLSVLPMVLFRLIGFLPFSYLAFFPLNVYLGRLGFKQMVLGILIQVVWVLMLFVLLRLIWRRGLRLYEAVGV